MIKIVGAILGCVLVLITACTAFAENVKAEQQSKPVPMVQQAQQWQSDACQQMHDTFVSYYGLTDQEATQQTHASGC